MPAMMKCPFCDFDGPHGFTEPRVGGIVHFYHTPSKCEGSWHVDNQAFPSLAKAWKVARALLIRTSFNVSDTWLAAWDARIIAKDEKKAKRLFAKWKEEYS